MTLTEKLSALNRIKDYALTSADALPLAKVVKQSDTTYSVTVQSLNSVTSMQVDRNTITFN